ncbi:hypothetical protein [Candidatus Ichthyocystis sparus]|uniref:hypothetical protein n=1 Tax=Candidatus Ichthyocystis sparus TaxID=1561004 RepID=UPI000B86BCA7|nr:hypothetical protein [Candidatus Ichthyocystis sparus]
MINKQILSPNSLAQLAMGAILRVSNSQSMSHISQVSTHEMVDPARIVEKKKQSPHRGLFASKYEFSLEMIPEGKTDIEGKACNINVCDKIYCDDYKPLCFSEGLIELETCRSAIEEVLSTAKSQLSKYLPSNRNENYWGVHPIYQLVNNKYGSDIIRNYQELEKRILSLPEEPPPCSPTSEQKADDYPDSILHYRDPLCFLNTDCLWSKRSGSHYVLIGSLSIYTSLIRENLDKSLLILENSTEIPKNICSLAVASLLQVKHTICELGALLSIRSSRRSNSIANTPKTDLITESLLIITLARKVHAEISNLSVTALALIDHANFLSLEDLIKIFEGKIKVTQGYLSKIKMKHLIDDPSALIDKNRLENNKLLLEKEVSSIKIFLESEYRSLVPLKRSRVDFLKEKIDNLRKIVAKGDTTGNAEEKLDECGYVSFIKSSIEDLEGEIVEMETSMSDFS